MRRRSILETLDHLNDTADGLAAMPGARLPSRLHQVTFDTLFELLTLGSSMAASENGQSVPLPLRAMLTTLQHSKPMLMEQMANVPEDVIRDFARNMTVRMQAIVDTPDDVTIETGAPGSDSDPAGGARVRTA